MKIFIRTPSSGTTHSLDVEITDTIETVKKSIMLSVKDASIDADNQHLVFAGKQLDDGLTLSDYNIQNDATLMLKTYLPPLLLLKHSS